MTTILDENKQDMEGYAIVYFADSGFELFTSNLDDPKIEVTLTNYPTLMGMMQDQKIDGLASSKMNNNTFLFAYALNLKNLNARDSRLKHKTVTIINFVVSRELYKELIVNFDDFEQFLESYFQPIRFLFDLYAVDFTKVIPIFQERQRIIEKTRKRNKINGENSLAIEFNNWLKSADFSNKKDKS
ncbi:MAG: hypothetical protein KAJ72_03815 [Candidatus Heimdallarchaeota archaeon]|nr:hypothetical protein [Candidatus Heimdallarchaeota archaeon]